MINETSFNIYNLMARPELKIQADFCLQMFVCGGN